LQEEEINPNDIKLELNLNSAETYAIEIKNCIFKWMSSAQK